MSYPYEQLSLRTKRLATAFVTLSFASCGIAASLENLRFENFASGEDLPSLWARSVFQDEKGYVWIPTNNNLVRYDSQRFRAFIPNPDVKGAISTNKPVKVISDSEGNLWVASPQGLDRFDYDTEQFENFPLLDPMGQSLSRSPNLFELMHDGRLLLGTLTGLYLFDPKSLAWSERLTGIGGPQTRFKDAFETSPGRYLVATTNGVWSFDVENLQLKNLSFISDDGEDIGKSDAASILVDNQQRTWIALMNDRLYCFDRDGKQVRFKVDGKPYDETDLTHFRMLFLDKDGILWATPLHSGLIALPTDSLDFIHIKQGDSRKGSLPANSIHSIYELQDGTLCFGTESDGVFKLDSHRLPLVHHRSSRQPNGLPFRAPAFLAPAPDGQLWVINSRGQKLFFDPVSNVFIPAGEIRSPVPRRPIFDAVSDKEGNLYFLTSNEIFRYEKQSNNLERLNFSRPDQSISRFDFPTQLFMDSQGILWLLGGRIHLYDPRSGSVTRIRSPKIFGDGRTLANCAYEMSNGDVWIGTRNRGIHYYSRSQNSFTRSLTPAENPLRLKQRPVYDIEVDNQSRVWVATSGGLTRWDPSTETFENFYNLEGLGTADISGLAFDSEQCLWAISSKGLFCYDLNSENLQRFTNEQGLLSQSFSRNAFEMLPNGYLAIGGSNGLKVIDTSKLTPPTAPPKPMVTRIMLTDDSAQFVKLDQTVYAQNRNENSITLNHDQNTLILELASFNYSRNPNHSLLYKIDGLIGEWTSIGQQNELIFPSLSPGKFTFRLKAETNNGFLTSEETTIDFSIRPPYWKTIPFQSAGAIIAILAILGFFRNRTRIFKATNNRLEKLVTERTIELQDSREEAIASRDEAENANKAKSRFLASVTHEIRTPMNGIIGMNHMLMQANLAPEVRQYASVVSRSAESMLELINDILDLSRIETGKFDLESNPFNLLSVFEEIAEIFAIEALEKQIDFKCLPDPKLPYSVIGDSLRVKQAIMNLVGNAIKFTSEGSVTVDLRLINETAQSALFECHIKDTGIGIAPGARDYLFEAFAQADSSTARKFGGTGLGLSITKNLVEAMDGCIHFDSEPGKGTVFWFTFELEKDLKTIAAIENTPKPIINGTTLLALPDNEIANWVSAGLTQSGFANLLESNATKLTAALDDEAIKYVLIDRSIVNEEVRNSIHAYKSERPLKIIAIQKLSDGLDQTKKDSKVFDTFLNYPLQLTQTLKTLLRQDTLLNESSTCPTIVVKPVYQKFTDKRVLIVDDNRTNQEVMKAFLSSLAITPDEAFDGEEAVSMSQKNRYDLIFMDCLMPKLDGYEATQLIRSDSENPNATTPIIALTANEIEGDREHCLKIGMNDYLSKPIRPKELSTLLIEWLPSPLKPIAIN